MYFFYFFSYIRYIVYDKFKNDKTRGDVLLPLLATACCVVKILHRLLTPTAGVPIYRLLFMCRNRNVSDSSKGTISFFAAILVF